MKRLLCILFALMLCAVCCAASAQEAVETDALTSVLQRALSASRSAGSDSEREMAAYMAGFFASVGLSVSTNQFSYAGGTSQNVSAVRFADGNRDSAPILIVGARLDTLGVSVGAVQGSGALAVMAQVARECALLPGDTEIRFVLFGAEEENNAGSRAYLAALSKDERARVIGMVSLSALGDEKQTSYYVETVSGDDAAIARMAEDSAKAVTGKDVWMYAVSNGSHAVFASDGIPSVQLESTLQKNGTVLDNAARLDVNNLRECALIMEDMIKNILVTDGSSLLVEARDGELPVQTIGADKAFDFSMSKEQLDLYFGRTGRETALGVLYHARLFSLPDALPMAARFENGVLSSVLIDAERIGYSYEDMLAVLTQGAGEGTKTENGVLFSLPLQHYSLTLEKNESGYTLLMLPCNEMVQYGEAALSNGAPAGMLTARQQGVWSGLLEKILIPEYRALLSSVSFESDGEGGNVIFVRTENNKNVLVVDLYELTDENGEIENSDAAVYAALRAFAELLSLKNPDLYHAYTEKFALAEDVDRAAYFKLHQSEFVSVRAADSELSDFCESFACYVLSDSLTGDSVAAEKMAFFAQADGGAGLRDYLRAK